MAATEIEVFYEAHLAVYQYLLENHQLSFANDVNSNFRRSLVLAIASYFEHQITDLMREVPKKHAGGNSLICALIEQKAISRQYHQYFDWETTNANKFFSMFGFEFRDAMHNKVRAEQSVEKSIRTFLELGALRNRLVHQNFVAFDIDKSVDDIMAMYRAAIEFIIFLRDNLLNEPI